MQHNYNNTNINTAILQGPDYHAQMGRSYSKCFSQDERVLKCMYNQVAKGLICPKCCTLKSIQ